MAKYNLTTIRPRGFLHSSAFDDVKSSLAWALAALGHEALSTENGLGAGGTDIIFGAELLPPGTQLPPSAIIYNLEQPTHPNMPAVRQLAKGHRVWDFSLHNLAAWVAIGNPATHVPIGYTPNLTRIPKAVTQDIDVCFLGWLTPRRRAIVDSLRAAGLNVFASDACYGGMRDQVLSRSKVCLNVHHDGRTMFEIVRVSYLLANSKCVVTETSEDEDDYTFYHGEIHQYDHLVRECAALCKYSNVNDRCAEDGFKDFRQRDFVPTVARALDTSRRGFDAEAFGGIPGTITSVIQSRYAAACADGDMAAFAPWLREHAKGDVLEIGTRDGASTSALLLGLEAHGGHLTSLDIDDRSSLWTHPQWTFIRANSITHSFPDNSFDIALIDGAHELPYFIGDLYNCFAWVRPGGMILCHDILPERGHEFYSVLMRREWLRFVRGDNPTSHVLPHEELPGRYGMGVFTVAK